MSDDDGVDEAAIDETGQVDPDEGLVPLQENPVAVRREGTRQGLAYGLIAILGVLVLVGCGGWMYHGSDTERMQNFAVLFGPVVTLLGTILGFYFSSTRDDG